MASSSNKRPPSSGKGGGSKASNRAAAERRAKVEEMMRKQAASKRRSTIGFSAILVVVVLIIGGLVGWQLTKNHGASVNAADTAVVRDITTVPAASYDTAGADTADVTPPAKIPGTALKVGDKPEVLYVGAEYCPFCAAERWAFVTALSRFGTFSNLGQTSSSPTDEYPNTATLSFHGASYTSQYIALKAYETEDTNGNKLDSLDSADNAVFSKYDAPPLTTTQSAGSIPFIDFGGLYAVSGASYTPQVLAGKSHAEIASAITDPTSTIGKPVLSSANYMTAAICKMTNNQPADVCTSSGVTAAAAGLPTTDVGSSTDPSSNGNLGSTTSSGPTATGTPTTPATKPSGTTTKPGSTSSGH